MDLLLGLALSAHIGFEGTYNGVHPHLRLETEQVIAGMYYNSQNRTSIYIGKEFEFDNYFVEGGLVTGYPGIGIAIPYGRAGFDINNDAKIFIAPGFEKRHDEIKTHIVIGIEFFKKVY